MVGTSGSTLGIRKPAYISAVAKEDTKGWTSQGLRMKDMEPKTWFKSQPGIYQLVVLDQVPTYLPTTLILICSCGIFLLGLL